MTIRASLQHRWRAARMRDFVKRCGVTDSTRILDIGGDSFNWKILAEAAGVRPQVTVLNVFPASAVDAIPRLTWVVGTALDIPFPDSAFDIAFSNSVIEHLGTRSAQDRFAAEAMRVARRYWIQTPNRWFPLEPHLLCPFIAYLPRRMQRPLYPLTPWALTTRGITTKMMDQQFDELRLLSKREFRELFPRARLITERLAGLSKCFIAMG
jgi:SAM-dependent methyltransferase